jgi:putative restriction endonuclease
LVALDAHGGLTESDYSLIRNDLNLQTLAIHKILDGHFPRSIHEDIIEFFDLRLSGARASDDHTESEFRLRIVTAYDNACALTGYSLGYRRTFPGLDAAHICWPQAGGNDDVCNGIAMTTLHRKLFHLGLFTIDENMKVVFCSELADMSRPGPMLAKLKGKKISLPKKPQLWPSEDALRWHRKWVFRG